MFQIYAKTARTDWIFIEEFETREQARKRISELLEKDAAVTYTIEQRDNK
jgi:hypothetical protein